MSIRVRWIKNEHGKKVMVARCAAKYKALEGDLYLDDNVHYALYEKFYEDLVKDGYLCYCCRGVVRKRGKE